MKTPLLLCCGLLSLLGLAQTAQSQTLYYNTGTNPGWLASTAWAPDASGTSAFGSWVNGRTAQFNPSGAISLAVGGTVSVANMINGNASVVTITNGSTTDLINFNGGQISGNFSFAARTGVVGNFEVVAGAVSMSSGGSFIAITGTATVSGGSLNINAIQRVGTTSDFRVAGGDLNFQGVGTSIAGDVTVDSGNFFVGRTNGSNVAVSVTSLQGTGGLVATRTDNDTNENSLIINQSTNTQFSGAISGTGDLARLTLTKSGTGSLTLSGTISGMQRTTTVNAGTLIINSNNTSFGDAVGSTAIAVSSSATLSGTGTITTLAGDNVALANGARMTAGLNGTADRTTFALGSGSALDLTAVTSATGWLVFDLGADTLAGSSYDQILLTGGSLNIGTGLLNFDDFSFNTLSGFAPGLYTLFNTTDLNGTLGSNVTGVLGGYDSTLLISGDLVQLNVVPEPHTVSAIAFGVCALGLVRILRRRTS